MTPQSKNGKAAKAFDLLALAAAFAQRHGVGLNDPALPERFVADVASRLKTALGDAALLHGIRAERMFEAMVVSLGHFRLFKIEDVGRVHPAAGYRAPDFRIVLEDGDQWLVEVKNVRREDPTKQWVNMSSNYVGSLRAYADAVGVPLRLAIYWSRWNLWTIVDPDRFRRPHGGIRVEMLEAIAANEFGRLGDVSIFTKPPLRVVIDAAIDRPRTLSPEGLAEFSIGSVRFFSGDEELADPRDCHLAQLLLLYGDWPAEGPLPIMKDGIIAGVEFVAAPELQSYQGFDGIGWASRIFARYFAVQTVDAGHVIQLHGAPAPEWFAPLSKWDFKGSRLPLWLFRQESEGPEVHASPVIKIITDREKEPTRDMNSSRATPRTS